MRIVLSILLGLFVLLPSYGCGSGKPVSTNGGWYAEPEYEIVISFFEYGNTMDRIMDVIFQNNMFITNVEKIPLANDKYGLKIRVKNAHPRQLSIAKYELRKVINVMSITIERS